jgi:hypothetical protein
MSLFNWRKTLGHTFQGGGGKGGGGGGGQPTQTTSTSNTSNIPAYAQPYVETMLGATQKQLFNMDDSGNITGFSPYKAYGGTYDAQGNQTSYDPSKGIAGFSALQRQAQEGVAGLRMPGQYQQGSQMVGAAGTSSLDTANQARNAGTNYQQMATDPNSIQQYMNPYVQASLQPQLNMLAQQGGIQGAAQQGAATQAGAFGGSRSALANALSAQNNLMAQQQAIGQGYNQAFQQAQQAQQFGANLGLQGQETALRGYNQAGQAGSALAAIGGQELAAQQGIYGLQNQYGKEQQAQQQQILNQSMQDYANAQQYPLMQLGTMSNMLRGLPMQASTTNQYVAAPNPITQGIGLAGAGASIYNAVKKEGGVIKEKKMAAGGIASYRGGDLIDETENDLYDMPPEALQKELRSPSKTIARMAERILKEKTGKAGGGILAFEEGGTPYERRKAAIAAVESAIPEPSPPADYRGSMTQYLSDPTVQKASQERQMALDAVRANNPVSTGFTQRETQPTKPSGSILSAAPQPTKPVEGVQFDPTAGGNPAVTNLKNPTAPEGRANLNAAPSDKIMPTSGIKLPSNLGLPPELAPPVNPDAGKTIQELIAEKQAYMGPNEGNQKARATAMAERASAADEAKRMTSLRMAEFFGAWGSTPGNTIVAGLNALKNKIPDFISDIKEESKIRRSIDKDIAELDKIDRLEKAGDFEEAAKRKRELSKEAVDVWGTKVKAYSDANQTSAYREAAHARASGEGGVAKNYNQAVIRYQTEDRNIATEKKNDDEYKMAKRTLSIPSKENDPKALEIVKKKEAAWNDRLAALKEDVDYYKKKQGRETGASETATDKKGAPGTASNPIKL